MSRRLMIVTALSLLASGSLSVGQKSPCSHPQAVALGNMNVHFAFQYCEGLRTTSSFPRKPEVQRV
jgi:hypothetical protein